MKTKITKITKTLEILFYIIFYAVVTAVTIISLFFVFKIVGKVISGIGSSINYKMSNDEIIAEVKKCTEAGLDTSTIVNGLTFSVRDIQCVPKRNQ